MPRSFQTIAICIAAITLLSACGQSSQKPDTSVHSLTVTGTDESISSETNRADISPYGNEGKWAAEYELGNFPGLAPQLFVRSNSSSNAIEEILYDGTCINNADCSLGLFSCTFDSDNKMTCSWDQGPGPAQIDLSDYLLFTGGIPNFSNIGIRGCYLSAQGEKLCGEAQQTPVTIR